MKKTGVLLVNLGTPDSTKVSDVRKYLFQFLNDPRVIDLPWLTRKLLVNLIIVPFRAPKSAEAYRELWTEKGSPLLYHSVSLTKKLNNELGENFHIELAMRYQNPSIEKGLEQLRKFRPDQIIVLPLFPQYASASTGSVMEKVFSIIKDWWAIPEINIISQFYDHPGYIDAFVEKGNMHNHSAYDHVLFSFHGLPERHVDKVYDDTLCKDHNCENGLDEENHFCYKATCYETARKIAGKMSIPTEKYSVSFQSRLGKDPWIEPYTEETLINFAKSGKKKILVFSPAFVADCLETSVEISIEYDEIFKAHGGEKIQLVESLNDSDLWVQTLKNMILSRSLAVQKEPSVLQENFTS
ncbi:MAG: ferrochelatase [Flavobacteriales bacterium]|nr:ferrochelatase [Flavobacteriales bacterium]